MAVVKAGHGHESGVTGLVQGTQSRVGRRSRPATLLLGIEGLAVVAVDRDEQGVRVVQVVTDDDTAAACPACGVMSTSLRGAAVTTPRDIPYGDRPIRLVWHKRRWRCREAGCPRGSFTESVPAVPARARLTTRLRRECGAGIADRFTCVSAGADYFGVSWPVAHAAYVAHVTDPVSYTHLDVYKRQDCPFSAPLVSVDAHHEPNNAASRKRLTQNSRKPGGNHCRGIDSAPFPMIQELSVTPKSDQHNPQADATNAIQQMLIGRGKAMSDERSEAPSASPCDYSG